MKMLKHINFKLATISLIVTLSFLIVMPKTPVVIDNFLIRLNSHIGGYQFSLFNNKFVFDFSEFKKGLDIQGGIRLVLQADMSKILDEQKDNALESAKEVISNRINFLGVSEPNILTSKSEQEYRIIVEVPGVSDIDQAVDLLGKTAQLKFKSLKPNLSWSEENFLQYFNDPTSWVDSNVSGADLQGVEVVVGMDGNIQNQGNPQIQLQFTTRGREKFSELAKQNINRPVALFLDDSNFPLSTPVISSDLASGVFSDPVISGNFDIESAKNLSIQIRAGALPVPVKVIQQQKLDATLGQESISKSFFAGIIGLGLVFLFLLFRYRELGLLAGISLFIYSLLTLSIFKIIPVVLTLPGIAGFILSIGMATDANVLIFERYKEEIRWGKNKFQALEMGFNRAWSSIKDSNISSLITCFILFQLGSGPVKGFALTLAIGILVSLFSSIYVVKTFIQAFKK